MRDRLNLAAGRRFVPARALLASAIWLLMAAPCLALECRVPQPAGAPGTIEMTPAEINDMAKIFASGDPVARISDILHALRSRHPNMSSGELVNYLVAAYCPVLNALTGLSEGEKQVRMDIFASQAAWAAY